MFQDLVFILYWARVSALLMLLSDSSNGDLTLILFFFKKNLS